jgi:subtilase family serine protease
LDIQYIASTGRNGTSSFWVVSGWLNEFLQELTNNDHAPEISSISWGADERQEGASYNENIDSMFKALGATGLTFLAASGDAGSPGTQCRSHYALNPGYPATSPYVLSVGATMFDSFKSKQWDTPFCQQQMGGSGSPCAESGHEVPADVTNVGFSSGGGFSTYAAQPSWQAEAVAKYNQDISIPKVFFFFLFFFSFFKNSSASLPPRTTTPTTEDSPMWLPRAGTSLSASRTAGKRLAEPPLLLPFLPV